MKVDKIKCSEIGINGIRKIISEYRVPSLSLEKKWIDTQDYSKLYLHHIAYPYGVARKYYFEWISKEEMIDVSINGFARGLEKYLEEEREFRIGEYVVWWSMRSCTNLVVQKIWTISATVENLFFENEELKKNISEVQGGNMDALEKLDSHYKFLFDIIERKYEFLGVRYNRGQRIDLIKRVINNDLSLDDSLREEFYRYNNELGFEDKILLEYSLVLEAKLNQKNK